MLGRTVRGALGQILRAVVMALAVAEIVLAFGGSAQAMTYHDNVVDMPLSASGYRIVQATYKLTGFSVTSGQDPNGYIYVGLTKTYSGNSGSMTFKVGRKGSTQVASWWKSNISSSQSTFGHDPGDLNFAFIGTLQLTLTGGVLGNNQDTYTLSNVAIGQGHAGASNNWWFGGKSCTHASGNTATCTGLSSAGYVVNFTFLRGGNAVNEIKLTQVTYPSYTLFSVQTKYLGESTGCTWQRNSGVCPPSVMYYNSSQSAALKLTVKNGLLYNSLGSLFDTSRADPSHSGPAAIFVMDSSGNIFASNANKVYLFHHSTILGGQAVASAGELQVNSGEITLMTNCSGHYMPSNAAILQFIESLHRQGYTKTFQTYSCAPSDIRY